MCPLIFGVSTICTMFLVVLSVVVMLIRRFIS